MSNLQLHCASDCDKTLCIDGELDEDGELPVNVSVRSLYSHELYLSRASVRDLASHLQQVLAKHNEEEQSKCL